MKVTRRHVLRGIGGFTLALPFLPSLLSSSEAKAAPDYLAFSAPSGTALFRRYDLADDADTLAAKISAFIASEVEPELAEPVIIRSAANLPEELTPHMRAIVDWHFGLA